MNLANNNTLETPLLASIRARQTETTQYLLGLPQIQIGLVEAAALGYKEELPRLIQEFEEEKSLAERFGLSGNEIAFIFSGLSGDMDLVLDLYKKVDNNNNVNVGMDTPLKSVGYYAVESGNVDLVRCLVQDYGLSFDSSTSKVIHNSVLFNAVRSVQMMDFLVHELKIDNFHVIDDSHHTLLTPVVSNGDVEMAKYLLEQDSLESWSARSAELYLANSMYFHNDPELNHILLGTVNQGNVDTLLRQALRSGKIDMAKAMLERFSPNELLSKEPPENWSTMLEEAIYSGSQATVRFVLQLAPSLGTRLHKNGYSPLVAACRHGSVKMFEELVQFASSAPDGDKMLNAPVWGGQSLLMVACSEKSSDIVRFMLEDVDFYERHCRGNHLDVNTTTKQNMTALTFAVQNGCVEDVDLILSKKEFLKLEEIHDPSKVTTLFLKASRRPHYASYLECFEKHGLNLKDAPESSLAMTAAEEGNLFVEAPEQLERLLSLDQMLGQTVSDDDLLCTIIRKAPEWAVQNKSLANLVKEYFADKEVMSPKSILDEVLARCDLATLEYCKFDPSTLNQQETIFQALQSVDMERDKKKKVPHPSSTCRRAAFLRWIMKHCSSEKNSKRNAKEVLACVIKANLSISDIQSAAHPRNCTRDDLEQLLMLATKFCQLENIKILVKGSVSSSQRWESCGYPGGIPWEILCI